MKNKIIKRLEFAIGLVSLSQVATFAIPYNSHSNKIAKLLNSHWTNTNSSQEYDFTKNDFNFINEPEVIEQAKALKFDPRKLGLKNYLTSVKNQGKDGLCWSFAAISAAEASIIKSFMWMGNPEMLDLSEVNLDWNTNTRTGTSDLLQLNEGDVWDKGLGKGNNSYYAVQTLTQWLSPVNVLMHHGENMYSYITPDYKVQNVITIPQHRDSEGIIDGTNVTTIEWMKKAIIKYGTLTAAFEVTKGPEATNTYYNTNCINGSSSTGHVITIVGWDDNIDPNLYSPAAKIKGGWICKNSWGTRTQEDGYFYMSYDSMLRDIIGYQYMPFNNTYENNYYWDAQTESGLTHEFLNTKKAINIFPVKKGSNNVLETIDGVQVGVNGLYSKVRIKIYNDVDINLTKNPDDCDFNLKTPVYTQEEFMPMPGIYTIKLKENKDLIANKHFAVEVEIIEGENGPSYPSRIEDNSSLMIANGNLTSSQNDLSYIYDKMTNKYIRSNSIQNSNNVVRIRALTNTRRIDNNKTNDLSYAKLKLNHGIVYLDDASTYPTFESLTLDGLPLDINDFNVVCDKILWNNVTPYNNFKNIGTVQVSITPKQGKPYTNKLVVYLTLRVGRAPSLNGMGYYQNIETNGIIDKYMGKINLYAGPSIKKYKDFKLPQGFTFSNPDVDIDLDNVNVTLSYKNPANDKFYRTTNWSPRDIKIIKQAQDAVSIQPISLITIPNHENEVGFQDKTTITKPDYDLVTPPSIFDKPSQPTPPNPITTRIPTNKFSDNNNSVMLWFTIGCGIFLSILVIILIAFAIKHNVLKRKTKKMEREL